jgi:hypothetical protein
MFIALAMGREDVLQKDGIVLRRIQRSNLESLVEL